jgi:hypothetical protein
MRPHPEGAEPESVRTKGIAAAVLRGLHTGRPQLFRRPENLIFIGVSIDPFRQLEAERCANMTVGAVENAWNMFPLYPRLNGDTS